MPNSLPPGASQTIADRDAARGRPGLPQIGIGHVERAGDDPPGPVERLERAQVIVPPMPPSIRSEVWFFQTSTAPDQLGRNARPVESAAGLAVNASRPLNSERESRARE